MKLKFISFLCEWKYDCVWGSVQNSLCSVTKSTKTILSSIETSYLKWTMCIFQISCSKQQRFQINPNKTEWIKSQIFFNLLTMIFFIWKHHFCVSSLNLIKKNEMFFSKNSNNNALDWRALSTRFIDWP